MTPMKTCHRCNFSRSSTTLQTVVPQRGDEATRHLLPSSHLLYCFFHFNRLHQPLLKVTRFLLKLHPTKKKLGNKMKETMSNAHEDRGVTTRKQKAEKTSGAEHSQKKPKAENEHNHEKSVTEVAKEFQEFCRKTREHLSVKQMRDILEANELSSSSSDDAVVPKCQDLLFSGPLERCPVCSGDLEYNGVDYTCNGIYSAWSSCCYRTRHPSRRNDPIKIPDSIKDSPIIDLIKSLLDPSNRPAREVPPIAKLFSGMMISLSGRLSRTHQYWKNQIERNGGRVTNSVKGATCLVVSPTERDRGGSSKVLEAMEGSVPVVSEFWLMESIDKQECLPLDSYDVVSDLSVEGRSIPLDKLDPSEEALETLSAELKMFGKRAVHKDAKLQDQGAQILEKDGILYNCAFCLYDLRHRINEYAMMETGTDYPELPMGIVTSLHLHRCAEALLEFIEMEKSSEEGNKRDALWAEFSHKWFALLPSTRPFIFRDHREIADHAAAALETVRDITVASHLVGDLTGSTLEDPLSARYQKLGCKIQSLDRNSDDYKMILNYLEKTYEPVRLADIDYAISVDAILSVESEASPSYDEIKKLPNKVLLWCGTRTSNLMRHLSKGLLPAICSLPAPGYMFGRSIVCSDAAAEAARYGFTSVDRPEGFLVLAVVSLGDKVTEIAPPPQETESLEEKKMGVKGLGRKKPDETEYREWKDGIKVPCGSLVESKHKDSPLEFNEYAVYDPRQVSMMFLVAVKFEEKGVVMETTE